MKERVKIFTYASSEGSTLIEPELEKHINDWLAKAQGSIVNISQSECQRSNAIHHTTVCVWYVPGSSGPVVRTRR